MCQSPLIMSVSLVFSEFNSVGSLNEGKTTTIISNSKIEILVSYSRSRFVKVNISFPNSNFEGNIRTYVFGKSFWHYRSWKLIVGHRDIYYAQKILNAFVCVEVRILVVTWNIYEAHNFPRPLLQTCRIGNDFFLFKYPVTCKQKIFKFSLFLLKLM